MGSSVIDLNGVRDLENIEPLKESENLANNNVPNAGFLNSLPDETELCISLRDLNTNKWKLFKRFDYDDLSSFSFDKDLGDVNNALQLLKFYHSEVSTENASKTRLEMLKTMESYVKNISTEIQQKIASEEPYPPIDFVVDLAPYFFMADDYTQSIMMHKHSMAGKNKFEQDKERLSRSVDRAMKTGKFRIPRSINNYTFLILDWLYPVEKDNELEAHSKIWSTLVDRRDLYKGSINMILFQKKTDNLRVASYPFILGYSIKTYMNEMSDNGFVV
jgi:hypothetical protein